MGTSQSTNSACPPNNIPASYNNSPPAVTIYEHDNCHGQSRSLPAGWHDIGSSPWNFNDAVSSISVPPNTIVKIGRHNLPFNHPHQITRTFTPDLYRSFDQLNLKDDTNVHGLNDTTSVIEVISNAYKSHPEFLRDCCFNVEPEGSCANYAGPNQSACQPTMQYHCGLNLDWFQKPICKRWGESHQPEYDAIAQKLCTGNQDPYCACYNVADNIVRPTCFDAKCTAATAYKPYDSRKGEPCGVFCNMQVSAVADKSVLIDNNQFVQNCGNEAATIRKEISENKKGEEDNGDEENIEEPPTPPGEKKIEGSTKGSSSSRTKYLILGGGGVGICVMFCVCLMLLALMYFMM
jgi:hypothetical protein